MAEEKKYEWSESGQLPEIDPHSKIKHQIIRDYLETYVQVLMRNPRMPKLHLSLVDGFCGGGLYLDEGTIYKGSPYILLEAPKVAEAIINQGRKNERVVSTQHFFVDIEHDYVAHLQKSLIGDGYGSRFDQDIYLLNNDIAKALPGIIAKIKSFKGGGRALFLLDQYSYKNVPMPMIRQIFQELPNAEVLLTFNVDTIITYIADKKSNRRAIEKIGLDKHIPWSRIPEIKSHQRAEWKSVIQNYFAEGIRQESSAQYMTLFFITPHGPNPWTYWFIHLANSFTANDVMKDLHWKHGNLFSHSLTPSLFLGYDANHDARLTGQDDLALGQEHAFEEHTRQRIHNELSDELPRKIFESSDGIAFSSLMGGIANKTMANAKLTRESLDTAVKASDIEVVDPKTGTRRAKGSSIKSTDIIIPSRQRPIFLLPPVAHIKKDDEI